jgi:hypothetical protein
MQHYSEKTGGLPQCQTLVPNLHKRHRQTGLDAEGVTPELLRLKLYWSLTWNSFFFFSLSVCLSCSLFVLFTVCLSTISICWFLWLSIFFFFFFYFLFLSCFC